ncbi:hypothetical protein [Shewanella baltica]|jgi:hypothetical protein|uniref:hypothetical protein n=1 Tax=Shewanella baltica TaxID=62322 RepID=UPI00015881C0|nr:hypothetical protein [Shewanella baltica]ABS08873.1 conserved hypothetical protein [Shewanella baltica OS185]ACK46143.1 conserved hypothetical protein [Shewanella baltica OS223]AVT49104.1 hypothetical protein C8I07_15925 [Shewanella baltica]MCS6096885.1 hypothetical protein [Shewanella baltica]MCS6124789.1 hypothetical protein [Shewanella baltica]
MTDIDIEKFELAAHRSDIIEDVNNLIEKYRAIFGWDVPDIDENLANRLILNEVRLALDNIQNE